MKKLSTLILILLIFAIFSLSAEANIIIFPREPVDMSLSSSPETTILTISSSNMDNAEGYIANAKISIGESIPILALSFFKNGEREYLPKSELLRITAVTKGFVDSYNDILTDYSLNGEIFISFPTFDFKYNPYDDEKGNGLLFSVEYTGIGTTFNKKELLNNLTKTMDENYLSANVYILARAPWSEQFLMLKYGYNKPFECEAKEYSDFSIIMNIPISKKGNLLYASLYTRLADDFYMTTFQTGLVIPGEIYNRKLIPYLEFNSKETNLGIKVNF